MIISFLQGGLGNQLFQWAIAENLGNIHNSDICFDISFYSNQKHRSFELHKFNKIKANIVKDSLLSSSDLNIVNESQISDYNINYINPTYLYGYWQDEIFFKTSEVLIKKKLEISEELNSYIFNKFPILNENTVSMHIRRTDYLNLPDFHHNQSLEYYYNAFETFKDKNINVMVFSDDINWCKENIKFNNTYYVEGEDNITDLYTMSKCKNNIIANSTFSWWGAWLNNNHTKTVVCPKNWFGPRGPSNTSLLKDKWTII